MDENDCIDPEWTMQNDKLSVTVGINTRLWLCRKKKLKPTLIRLGKEHTALFLREHGIWVVPNKKPKRLVSNHLVWDEENNRLLYNSRTKIPIKFNDSKIIGIAVESEPIPPKPKRQAPRKD